MNEITTPVNSPFKIDSFPDIKGSSKQLKSSKSGKRDTICDIKQKKYNQNIIKIGTNEIINKQIQNNQIPELDHQNTKPDIKITRHQNTTN